MRWARRTSLHGPSDAHLLPAVSAELHPTVDYAGRILIEDFAYAVTVEQDGKIIFAGKGGERATVEQALRVICDRTQPIHLSPEVVVSFTVSAQRLRPVGPRLLNPW